MSLPRRAPAAGRTAAPARLQFLRVWQGIGWLLVLVVVVETLAPSPVSAPVVLWDKAAHLVTYGALMWWFRQSFRRREVWTPFVFLLGAVLEFAQGWTGSRILEYGDLLANGIGGVLGLGLATTALGRTVALLDRNLARLIGPAAERG